MSEETVSVTDKVVVDSSESIVKQTINYGKQPKSSVVETIEPATTSAVATVATQSIKNSTIQVPDNSIIINLNSNIEIANLTNGQRHSIMPKPANKVKMLNTNLYRIPITNKELNLDSFHAIKQYTKFAEFFTILSVSNGVVSILPIISGFELQHDMNIGKLI